VKFLRRLGHAWEKFQALYYRYLGRNYKCGCGHTAKWKTILTIHGHEGVFKAPSKTPAYCPQCWAQAAIKCAWCGGTIVPGDPITLYSPGNVGCLGWDCADTGADHAGFWVMPGKVQRVMSPLEMFVANDGLGRVISRKR